jgi:septation ring formation regulator EzrA
MPGAAVRVPVTAAGSALQGAREELETVLQPVEQRLQDLQAALAARDMPCTELHAGELQRSLAIAVERFMQAARRGGVPTDLRHRLALAGAQVAAQRDALARATAAMDRALDVLMPGHGTGPVRYSAEGTAEHLAQGSSLEV